MLQEALKVASHITHPIAMAAFASVIAASTFGLAIRAKKLRNAWILAILAIGIIVLGLAPLGASTYLQSRGVYRIRTTILGPDQSPVEDAQVSSSIGGEPKRVQGGWEFDVPPQTRPADGKVILFASEKSAFLTGSSTVVLAQDYYPTISIQLTSDISAMIRGVVVDDRHRSVVGATVSVPGYQDVAVTDKMGNFVLPAHVAVGQIVQVRAQKDQLVGSMSVPAGRLPVELIVKRP
jgi:hypothetical protein